MFKKSWELLCIIADSCEEHLRPVPVMDVFAIYLFFFVYIESFFLD